ncbi:crotonase/enoyl-CoA hydratase family protein [Microbacterium sp. BR1]|uniref:crotonase/enoyl-CoA hydratase family protein n=1 Tax=Microbacterium sp. BR1 TaxID=1070896 RepID=UPI000C2CB167|nr:crotonase/enoyl-CoA hydratase family protein [Microbacterium sp. BR1]
MSEALPGGLVRLEVADRIATILLDRPAKRNAVNRSVAEGLAAAVSAVEADSSVDVAVLTGAGGVFCAGLDLVAAQGGDFGEVADRGFAGLVEAPRAKPLIAAVEGAALGGGLELALSCDLIVAAVDARVALPEVSRGRIPGALGLLRLPHRLPFHIAMELALTGDPISVARLHQLGLVNEVTAAGAAADAARTLARRIARNSPAAVTAARDAIAETWRADEEARHAVDAERVALVAAGPDAAEGGRAFAERREPRWVRSG